MNNPAPAPSPHLPVSLPDIDNMHFLGGFADFYQEIAEIKRAHAEGRLAQYLSSDGSAPPQQNKEFAQRVSGRLCELLRQQQHDFQRHATAQEIKVHNLAVYLMAAVADEIFIHEFDWPGSDAWLSVLIERKLFKSRNAGTRFFQLCADLTRVQTRDPLYLELAAVILLGLALGFKGRYRGPQGTAALNEIRAQLLNLIQQKPSRAQQLPGPANAFEQAYRHLLRGSSDERLAPLSPWISLGAYALLAYLALSTVSWLILMRPVEQFFGG